MVTKSPGLDKVVQGAVRVEGEERVLDDGGAPTVHGRLGSMSLLRRLKRSSQRIGVKARGCQVTESNGKECVS